MKSLAAGCAVSNLNQSINQSFHTVFHKHVIHSIKQPPQCIRPLNRLVHAVDCCDFTLVRLMPYIFWMFVLLATYLYFSSCFTWSLHVGLFSQISSCKTKVAHEILSPLCLWNQPCLYQWPAARPATGPAARLRPVCLLNLHLSSCVICSFFCSACLPFWSRIMYRTYRMWVPPPRSFLPTYCHCTRIPLWMPSNAPLLMKLMNRKACYAIWDLVVLPQMVGNEGLFFFPTVAWRVKQQTKA